MVVNGHSYGRKFKKKNQCLYVGKTTYAKQSEVKSRWPLTTTLMEDKILCGSECYIWKKPYM